MLEYNPEVLNCNLSIEEGHNFSSALAESLKNIIQAEGYKTHSIYKRKIFTGGDSYLSILNEVDIKGKTDFNNKETNLIIKQCMPVKDNNLISPQSMMLRETFIYLDLAKVFNEMEKEYNVPVEEKYNFVKCYSDDNSDSLILENMTPQGFKTYGRTDVTPLKAMELSIVQLAKFHGYSMIIKQCRPDYFRNNIQDWQHPFTFTDNAENYYKNIYKNSIDVLENDVKLKLEKCMTELIHKYKRYLHNNESKTKCLCHGDFRMNNILVQEIDGEATKVIPIDFQLLHYGSPVIDLLYLIFTSTDQEVRSNEMENFKRIYFDSLKKCLQYFNIDVESVYPQKEFEYDFKNQLDYGLIMAILILCFLMVAEDDIPEFNAELTKIKFTDNFKPRLQGIVDDYVKWGYL